MLSTTASGRYFMRSWYRKLRPSTSSVNSPSRSCSTRARCSASATSAARSSRATAAGRNTSPHSTSTAARPRSGSSARAAALTSSWNSATSTSRRGAAASTRRATAWPTRPEPPSSITVRSRSSMQSLDGLDLPRREAAVFPLGEPSQSHGAVGDAVQPLHLQAERFGDAPHDALASLGERQLHLDAPAPSPPSPPPPPPPPSYPHPAARPRPALERAHRPPVYHDAALQRRLHLGGRAPVNAQPVRARHLEARVRQPVGGRPVGRQQQQPRRHHVQASNVREPRNVGEEVVDGGPPFGVAAGDDVADRLVEREPGRGRSPHGAAIDGDPLAVEVDAHPEGRDRAVHAHAAGANHLLRLASGGHARARQSALQAHQRHSGSAGAGGRGATGSSSSRGSSSRSLRPRMSRNCGVVPYSSGRPQPSPRVTTSTRPRSISFSITAPESTPRISSTSIPPTGWRYAMMDSVSRAAGESRRGRSANWARSIVSAYSRRVRNCHPWAISTSSTPCSSPA